MSIHYQRGGIDLNLSDSEIADAFKSVLAKLGAKKKVLALPPDMTRANSKSGPLLKAAYDHYGKALTDVMPALGTHFPMTSAQIQAMYPGVPESLFRPHDWRNDVVTLGEVDAAYVKEVTGGIYEKPWPCQLNKMIVKGGHDLILSIGQVVPHEVVGMANYTKNLFVGTGGASGINESHFIGAAYGMERMMGRSDTPVRRILNEGFDRFCRKMPFLFALTVVGSDGKGGLATRGLFIGDHHDCFEAAAKLSLQVNFILLDEQPKKVVCWLDPHEFHSTWLGNKAVYRTRMAIADQGELIVLAPAVKTFGEDPAIDVLIRKYGYRPSATVMKMVKDNADIRDNLSAAAHLIHGSSENRFTVRYCPGVLTRAEIEQVGYTWGDLATMKAKYDPAKLKDGWNTVAGERIYYISNPAMGLWAWKGRFA
jgi:nickel-dependent lactate racemase